MEIALEEKIAYFYMLFVADQLPFCILAETVYVEEVYQRSHGQNHLLSINLLSEMPKAIDHLPLEEFFIDISPEKGDHLFDWVNFKAVNSRSNLELIIESMGEDQWGLGFGFYNEERYITAVDLEVNEDQISLNQRELEKFKENYPQFLVAKDYQNSQDLDADAMRHIWIYNLLKKYI